MSAFAYRAMYHVIMYIGRLVVANRKCTIRRVSFSTRNPG